MNKNGEIIIIEDDTDDQFLMEQAFETLEYTNKRVYFADGLDALEYLHSSDTLPFLILSDINLPKLNGFELRKKLSNDAELNLKCIPYLYLTTAGNQEAVIDAYSSSAQGFFVKATKFSELQEMLQTIIGYWKKCSAPNDFD
ncbi:response regulator [Dyadobacter fanqingshengii]|uniref:Response regulator n=1 Tax=Dyadobacter fanqingshengii TaxID=2906443 RepID=A0A9X1PA80_9BACT|nr:response regulator [Dyadobacter fanqingshengii]MCF0040847.1 response regulator [Dyadobacter fanqingshengii]MCF2506048.1 response regulator [Dyadobacter fanqingshengii]USJ37420.1 response regulator [Dyadobacter fanqingshengii]